MDAKRGFLSELTRGIPETLPEMPEYDSNVDHAPPRVHHLSTSDQALALRNALRYFPKHQFVKNVG